MFSRQGVILDGGFRFLLHFRLAMALGAAHPFAVRSGSGYEQAAAGFTEHGSLYCSAFKNLYIIRLTSSLP